MSILAATKQSYGVCGRKKITTFSSSPIYLFQLILHPPDAHPPAAVDDDAQIRSKVVTSSRGFAVKVGPYLSSPKCFLQKNSTQMFRHRSGRDGEENHEDSCSAERPN